MNINGTLGRWGAVYSLVLGLGLVAVTASDGVLAQSTTAGKALNAAWEVMPTPETNGELALEPQLLGLSKPYLGWGWTNTSSKMVEPEFAFSFLEGSSWTRPRAPFFGSNVGNLRRMAVAVAKYTVGVIYQRNTEQSHDSFEILYSMSGDKGWSYTTPKVCDSYVHEDTRGTDVAIAGVGGRKPTFCYGWLAEERQVRLAILDPNFRGDRPRANNVGRYGRGCERVELAGEEHNGFVGVWNEGQRLMSAYITPLVGEAKESQQIVSGKIGQNFSLSDSGGRHPVLVYDLPRSPKNGTRRQVMTWNDKGEWEKIEAAPPLGGDFRLPLTISSCQDKDKNLYLASVSRNGESVHFTALRNGRFTVPELCMNLKPLLGVTGVSIACCGDYVFIAASQGPYMQVVRRSLKDVK